MRFSPFFSPKKEPWNLNIPLFTARLLWILLNWNLSRDLDQKRSDLTKVIKTERDLVAQLDCLRSHNVSLEKETVDLDVLIKDRRCSLELDSSIIKVLEQYLSLVDADLLKLSSDPAFPNEVRASHVSSIKSMAHDCIEDVLFSLQQLTREIILFDIFVVFFFFGYMFVGVVQPYFLGWLQM